MSEAVIVSGVRTAIGNYGGALQDVPAVKLGSIVIKGALKKAGLAFREMKQTRHSFATIALSCGENPLWIAQVMGHRNTEMIIKVYSRYIQNVRGSEDGAAFDGIYKGIER